MTGLLYKDWRIIIKTKALYFGLLYFLFIIPAAKDNNILSSDVTTNFFMIFIVYLFFSYLISYDYKYNGTSFIAAFPISRKNIVTARYIFILLAFTACLIIYLLILMSESIFGTKALNLSEIINYEMLGTLILAFGLYFGITMPLYYRYGYQKIKWLIFLSMIACNIVISILKTSVSNMNQPGFMIIAIIFSLFLYQISLRFSISNLEKSNI